jgi:hypothetical protein
MTINENNLNEMEPLVIGLSVHNDKAILGSYDWDQTYPVADSAGIICEIIADCEIERDDLVQYDCYGMDYIEYQE